MSKAQARALLTALALFFSVFVSVSPASATVSYKEGTDKAAVLFNPTSISTVLLTHKSGSPALTFDYLNSDAYRHADIKIKIGSGSYVTLKNVGVRLKGQASRNDVKFPMKVKFDAFVKGQKFLGLKRMTLNNMVQDPSFIHEATAYKLYRAAGVPAPRTGFSKVSVDGHYMGLYLNLESIDKVFGKRWFPSTNHIYSGPYNCDIVPGNTCYEASVGDTNRADLNAAGNVSDLHGEAWWTAINQVADMTKVIRLMATDVFMSNWDGYTDAVKNNHFVHFDKTGKLSIIPWGLDQTFTTDSSANLEWDGSEPIFRNWSDHRSTLFEHCLEYAPCNTLLLQAGVKVSSLATSVNLIGYKNAVAAVVNPIVSAAGELHQTDLNTLGSYQSWIDTFIPQRQQVLTNFLTAHSPQPLELSIPATVRAGKTITATIPIVWEPGVSASWQWFLDGEEIVDATSNNHLVLDSEIGHQLSVRLTLSKANVSDTVEVSSDQTVLARVLSKTPTPKISGTVKRGKTITAKPGTWDAGVVLTYQWYRNSSPISGSTSATYLIGPADRGQKLSVRVTGTKTNYIAVTKSSSKTATVG